MKSFTGFVVGAVLLATIGAVALGQGLLDRDLADLQARASAGDFEPSGALDKAERYYGYATRIPGVGTALVNDVRATRAELLYWQGRYAELAPADDALEPIAPDDTTRQFVVANALYRDRLMHARDKASTLAALDAGLAAYVSVLRAARRHEAAAFNYEYLIRLRDEISKGRRLNSSINESHGFRGRQEQQPNGASFKVYVPLATHEREIDDNDIGAAKAGKSAPIKRKG